MCTTNWLTPQSQLALVGDWNVAPKTPTCDGY